MTGNFRVSRRTLSARRVALLATTIAGIGAAALVFSPGTYPHSALAGAAQAQNLTEKVQQLPQRPVGFADIVEKVKPAVISVRVKIDRPANRVSAKTICRFRLVPRSSVSSSALAHRTHREAMNRLPAKARAFSFRATAMP